jgi:hypothetical protein
VTSPDQVVPLETLRSWAESGDPLLNDLAFHTAFAHADTVPGLEERERLEIVLRFLEQALTGRKEGLPEGPYVYAHSVLGWLQSLAGSDDPADRETLGAVVGMLERIAREGDAATRDVVLLGTLEHAFEQDATRALFDHWADDPDLRPLYEEARQLNA